MLQPHLTHLHPCSTHAPPCSILPLISSAASRTPA
ncbi:hypothetical protein E2C01_100813 [Portunus trituberculatus]|uniref:Uncharacterized protein n=1 Tax=Portunus trituberculatus TaxID=210409 RepID=A0A5B7KIH3_PORTR|nr:hypothetical protein [Portunus trituberculatus]